MMTCIVQCVVCISLFVLYNFGANANAVDGLVTPRVDYPFYGSDVLSMDDFRQYVVDRDMAGLYMMRAKEAVQFDCLEWTIDSQCGDNTTFFNSITFINSRQRAACRTKFTATLNEFEGFEGKAIFKLDNRYPKTDDVLVKISFSSRPELYILYMICRTWVEGESCPADQTIGLVTVPKEYRNNDDNRAPMEYIREDVKKNMNFDLTDVPDIFEWKKINEEYCSNQ